VVIFRVTELRPGDVRTTSAAAIEVIRANLVASEEVPFSYSCRVPKITV